MIGYLPPVVQEAREENSYHPSPATSEDHSDGESDSSDSSSDASPSSFSRESSVSEVDEFIAKTIDSLKHVVGRRPRGSVSEAPPLPYALGAPGISTTSSTSPQPMLSPYSVDPPPPPHHNTHTSSISFERRDSIGTSRHEQ